MKYHKQLIKHDPENGRWGDCARTAIACILDLEPAEVPHFFDGGVEAEEGLVQLQSWLRKLGLCLVMLPFLAENVAEALRIGRYIKHTEHMLVGKSPRGSNHVIVCRGEEMVHDPAPQNDGLAGPTADGHYWLSFLARRA